MEGKYRAYPEYKDSGVEWLGEVPLHWGSTELKRYSSVQGGYAFSSEIFTGSGKAIIRIGDIKQDGSVSLDSCKYISSEYWEQYQDYEVRSGDLLMAMTGATIGKAGWFSSETPALLNQRVGSFKCNDKLLNYRFFWHVLNSSGYQEYIKLTAFGGAQPNISDTRMVGYRAAFPLLEEQQKIANFLDHETAKIDTLIEKQQRLITLLKEKRQAVISHAVTKGLNPDVPMRDSGVEWLGEVPEHWEIMPLKFAITFQRGHDLPSQKRVAGVVPLVTSAGISSTHNVAIAKAPGLVTGRYGTIGKFDLLEKDYWPLNTTLYSINLRGNHPKYLWYMLHNLRPIFIANSLKSAVPGVDRNDLHIVKIAVPKDQNEQTSLCEYLDGINQRYEVVINKAFEQITLLRERRTALISAAVTGKIDVRDWQAPTQTTNESEEAAA